MSQNQTGEKRRLLCYAVGQENYCLEMTAVQEIVGTEKIQLNHEAPSPRGWLPGTPAPVPVFSLSGQHPPPTGADMAQGRVLVLDKTIGDYGLMVDHVLGMIEVEEEQILPLPAVLVGPQRQVLKGLVRTGDRWIFYTDPAQLNPEAAAPSAHPQTPNAPRAARRLPIPETAGVPGRADGRADGRSHLMLFSTPGADPREWPVSFGLSVTQVLELVELPEIILIPSAPGFVSGLINWRDHPVPVIDLNARLARDQSAAALSEDCRILIVRATHQEELAGLLIQPDTRVQPLPITHAPSRRELSLDRTMVSGMFELAEATMIIPDLDAVLGVAMNG